MRKHIFIIGLLLVSCLYYQAQAVDVNNNHAPVVTNVVAKQVDFEHVLIRYDVEDTDGDIMTVSVKVSANNKQSFDVPVTELEGAVGEDITSGTGKEIVWTITQDVALHQYGEGYVVAVMAGDRVVAELKRITWQKDKSEMVLIPEGSFEMGDNKLDNAPVHTVTLDAFYMDVHEVTVSQWRLFCSETGRRDGELWHFRGGENHPVVYVSQGDAKAYAAWAGKRLPTEAEWEKAARGGLVGKRFPRGDRMTHDDVNYSGTRGRDRWDNPTRRPPAGTSPVAVFEANGYGLYDMAGNAAEWCLDEYDATYYNNSPTINPTGPEKGIATVLRGGSWSGGTGDLGVAVRSYWIPSNAFYLSVGFRCVIDVDANSNPKLNPEGKVWDGN